MKTIHKIVEKNLCLGCGLCEAVLGKDNAEMQLRPDGFLVPLIKNSQIEQERIISRICPGVNIVNDQGFSKQEKVWGKLKKVYSGYSTDAEIRSKGSSGGVISGIAIYLLESRIVDAVLHVGGDSNDYKRNCLRISRTREDVLKYAASRYAPSSVFNEILEILNGSDDIFLFVGKPCDISGLKNLFNEFPQYRRRFKFIISIICAGIPSYNGTQDIIDTFSEVKYPIRDLVYRGDGWPGNFSFTDAYGKKREMSYNDSWGKILGKKNHFRCKVCPDGIGLQADIAVGDAWETKDGYPDFSEREGKSLIMIRTENALNLFKKVLEDKKVASEIIPVERIQFMQPYQFKRRGLVGIRVLATIIGNGVFLNFKGLRLFENLMANSVKNIILDFGGTLKRILLKK